jgi:hypothetical protein
LHINPTTGAITGTINTGDIANSPYSVIVKVTNSAHHATSQAFTWTINPVAVTNPGRQTNLQGDTVNLQIVAHNAVAGHTLTYSAANLPAGLSIDPNTGLISGTIPKDAATVTTSPTVTATDPVTNAVDRAIFQWVVNPVVTVSTPGTQTSQEGANIHLQINAMDAHMTALMSFSDLDANNLHTLPPGLTIDSHGLITGAISAGAHTGSPYTVTITVTDGSGFVGHQSFSWSVNA